MHDSSNGFSCKLCLILYTHLALVYMEIKNMYDYISKADF